MTDAMGVEDVKPFTMVNARLAGLKSLESMDIKQCHGIQQLHNA